LDALHDLFVHDLRDPTAPSNSSSAPCPCSIKPPTPGVSPEGKTCKGVQGIIAEARETVQEIGVRPASARPNKFRR
jgi:hypothetical protein